MTPIGDEDKENCSDIEKNSYMNMDFANDATQKIDSQYFPGDEDDDFLYGGDTMPLGDTFMMQDAYETQLVDPSGETQVIDFGGDTQVLDDLDCLKNLPDDLFDEYNAGVACSSDNEGTNTTEILCGETQEVYLDDYMNIDGGDPVGQKNEVDSYHCKIADSRLEAPSETLNKEEHHSAYGGFTPIRAAPVQASGSVVSSRGPIYGGFTSIRTASVRASGLAARARGAKNNLCSTKSARSSPEQPAFDHGNSSPVGDLSASCINTSEERILDGHNEDIKEQRNSNSCKVMTITAVRELFPEDEAGHLESDKSIAEDEPELEDCMAGLSYANSQLPGDLSQANALEAVDKFLEQNLMEFDLGFKSRTPVKEKPNTISFTKGSRDLAKSSLRQNTMSLGGVFDWDDNNEDERGGDFLSRKKELLFNEGSKKKKCLTEPRKRKYTDHKKVEDHVEEENQACSKKKIGYSDPGFMLHKVKAKEKSNESGKELSVVPKNLTKDLNESVNLATDDRSSDDDRQKEISEVQNIGVDTQMAAEAMEILCFEVNLADNSCPNKKSAGKTRSSKPSLAQIIDRPKNVGVATRRAKLIKNDIIDSNKTSSLSSAEHSENTKKQHDKKTKDAEKKMSDSKTDVLSRETECQITMPSEQDEQNKGTRTRSEKKNIVQDQLCFTVPVAHRTRRGSELNSNEKKNDLVNAPKLRKGRTTVKDVNAHIITIDQLRKLRSAGSKQLGVKSDGASASNADLLKPPQRKRTHREEYLVGQEAGKHSNTRMTRSRTVVENISPDLGKNVTKHPPGEADANLLKQFDLTIDSKTSECERLQASPGERQKATCTTPTSCAMPVSKASPICMGDEYYKQSCRKSLSKSSLRKELDRLIDDSPTSETKELRKRREITSIRVLFSQHLDDDVAKQQKKILARLGATVASSMSDATHFVADEFVRTRNMLEAIALGKPVVTHLWLESCGQANCLIDEKNHILRDVRKEKEFGFSMPVSLSRASQHPLLQGLKVLVTPNTKPGKDTLASLVKTVHGLVVERLGRSVLNCEKLPDDLLILSCEEDYDICVSFLEKGGAVYSSELLLNGIVTQKLEYERHRLFADHVKKTRSTIWLKKKNQFHPVTKC